MTCALLAHVKKDVRENRVAFFAQQKVIISFGKTSSFLKIAKKQMFFANSQAFLYFPRVWSFGKKPLFSLGQLSV